MSTPSESVSTSGVSPSDDPVPDDSAAAPSPSSETTASPTVEAHLAAVDAAVREQHDTVQAVVEDDVLRPLRAVLASALDAHAQAVAAFENEMVSSESASPEVERSNPTGASDGPWRRVWAYRRFVVRSVWEPLVACLDQIDVGETLFGARQALLDARDTLPDAVPSTVTRPEPDDLFGADASDPVHWRVRKGMVRAGRRIRGWIGRGTSPEQEIPLGPLVEHHARVRVAEAQASALDAVDQHIAAWVASVERVATTWTHRVLEAERVLDASDHHRPPAPVAANEEVFGAPDVPASDAETEAAPAAEAAAPDGTGPTPATPGPNPRLEGLLEGVREAAASLDRLLAEGKELGIDGPVAELATAATEVDEALRDDVRRAGTFMATVPPTPDRLPRRMRRDRQTRRKRVAHWPSWHRQAVERLALMQAVVALREAVVDAQDALGAEAQAAGVRPAVDVLAAGREWLDAIRADVGAILASDDASTSESDGASLTADRQRLRRLDQYADEALDGLEHDLLGPLTELGTRRAVEDAVQIRVDALTAHVAAQPETFVVHALVDPDSDAIDPVVEEQPVQWRALARETLDTLLFDAWRGALVPMAERVEAAAEDASEVRTIVSFHLGAAVEELQDLVAEHRQGEVDPAHRTERVEAARELAVGGIERSEITLTDAAATLVDAATPFVDATWRATTEAWARLHDRVRAAGRAREHVLRLQSVVVQYARAAGDAAQTSARRVAVGVRRTLQVGRRRAERLVRMGKSAVGGPLADETALQETVEALSTVDAALDDLPLVYRRLFSFRPVMDPDLLVGRDDDLRALQRHADQWMRGLPNAFVLTGAAGSGLTSVCNVLRKTTFRRARVHTLELTERVSDAETFAEQMATALGMRSAPPDGWTLDAVADRLLDQPSSERFRVCILEHLENTFLRTVGGTALVRRLLAFLSETDSRVLWIVTCSTAGWQVIEKCEPSAAELVTVHALDPFDRDELESLIMTRHRRSGLRLVFEAPDTTVNPILARRLQSAKDDARRQALLRDDYFDRLHGYCGQNVMLALFYWFRSVHLDADAATLCVRPVRPIRFDAIERFSLQLAFALKALLEHATLTVDELAEVLQTSPATSRSMLETLGNALLITTVEGGGPPGSFDFTCVEPGVRYRIRPLVIHPVIRFLRSRNIVH